MDVYTQKSLAHGLIYHPTTLILIQGCSALRFIDLLEIEKHGDWSDEGTTAPQGIKPCADTNLPCPFTSQPWIC
jgi:hypothetical protein